MAILRGEAHQRAWSGILLTALVTAFGAGCGPTSDDAPGAPPIDGGPSGDGDGGPPDVTATASVRSRTGVLAGTPGGAVVPGGMVAGHFDLPDGALHTRLDGTMRVEIDPGDTTSYFFAQQFWFDGGDGGYMGLQTNGIIDNATVGKMAIFSIWDALEATPGPAATCQPFGGEGVGMSCRLPLSWQANVSYRLRIEATQTEDAWRATVTPDGGEPVIIGTIQALSAWGDLKPRSAVFTEYYGQVADCSTIPLAQAMFEDINADEGAVLPERADAMAYGNCVEMATASCLGDLCSSD